MNLVAFATHLAHFLEALAKISFLPRALGEDAFENGPETSVNAGHCGNRGHKNI